MSTARLPHSGAPAVERWYVRTQVSVARARSLLVPYVRRLIRFFALPYCYVAQIDWDECTASRLRVAQDLLYIFFYLKYYPDNYSLCRLWTVDRSRWHLYYGSMYEPYQRFRLQREVQRPEYHILFSDKEVCQRVCTSLDLPVPRLLGTVDLRDDRARVIREALERSSAGRLMIKPVRGAGGRAVSLVEMEDGEIFVQTRGRRMPLGETTTEERSILQDEVMQHDAMAALYAGSLNTIRIQTLLTRAGEVVLLGAAARFGRNNSQVDNMSAGGLGVGVDITSGRLMRIARDFDSREYKCHPETGVTFLGYQVPFWSEARALVERAQRHFPFFRLLGFDIGIAPRGPVIIEINPWSDNVFVEECYGPLLSNPATVLAFDDYDLLINAPTRALAARLRGGVSA